MVVCGMTVLLLLGLAAREEALEKSHRSCGGVQQKQISSGSTHGILFLLSPLQTTQKALDTDMEGCRS